METSNDSTEKSKATSTKQSKAIAALLTERDVKTAAESAGISESTLHRWLDTDPEFRAELKQAESQAVALAVTRLAGSAGKALDLLNSILDDATVSAGVRVRVALGLLDKLITLKEFADFDARLARLESSLSNESN